MERETLKSRLGFILLSAGCAIGIGNVWKFPYMAGQGGGGAFVLFYLLIILYERYFDKLFVLYPREWLNPSPRWVFGKVGVAVLLTEFSVLMALAFAYAAKRRLERI